MLEETGVPAARVPGVPGDSIKNWKKKKKKYPLRTPNHVSHQNGNKTKKSLQSSFPSHQSQYEIISMRIEILSFVSSI